MMQILAVIERGEGENKKGFWTRIGVAFQNVDASHCTSAVRGLRPAWS